MNVGADFSLWAFGSAGALPGLVVHRMVLQLLPAVALVAEGLVFAL